MSHVLTPLSRDELGNLTKSQLITIASGEQSIRQQLEDEVSRLKSLNNELQEQNLKIEGQFVKLKNRLFGTSSESKENPKSKSKSQTQDRTKDKGSNKKKPSERYPNLPIKEKTIEFENLPQCNCCNSIMAESSLFEVSEELNVKPREYHIVRYFRKKYRCGKCYGSMITAPALPRIVPGSNYSDDLILDAALSKFCDLIPMERYSAMAARQGVPGIPANSLIKLTHKLADFLSEIYTVGLWRELVEAKVIRMDESPHRMLEGDERSNWYLWQFACKGTVYFEYHGSRSGDIAFRVLEESLSEFLLSDDFSGYKKAVKNTNKRRDENNLPPLQHALCNAHSRRKFHEASLVEIDAEHFIEQYGEIYSIESEARNVEGDERIRIRSNLNQIFSSMLEKAEAIVDNYSSNSLMAKALKYFISNYTQLTLFITVPDLNIDNNETERPMRPPAIGRKTWYGTHSKRGAKTAAIIFSLVESCKINGVNPREYLPEMVSRIHQGNGWVTPKEYASQSNTS